MIAVLALLASLQPSPQVHSAQCLVEVAAISGERLHMGDDQMRAAATQKTDALMAAMAEVAGSIAEFDRAYQAYAATVPAKVAAGELPPGSAEAVRERYTSDRAELTAPADNARRAAPSCQWPAISPPAA